MGKYDQRRLDVPRLREAIELRQPVLAIDLPDPLAEALQVAAESRVSRGGWRDWFDRVAGAATILYWVTERQADDQHFAARLALELDDEARLWTFHPMHMLAVDRLTGDALQTLLNTYGLRDGVCTNTGDGHYVRSFIKDTSRDPEQLPPIPAAGDGRPVYDAGDERR